MRHAPTNSPLVRLRGSTLQKKGQVEEQKGAFQVQQNVFAALPALQESVYHSY